MRVSLHHQTLNEFMPLAGRLPRTAYQYVCLLVLIPRTCHYHRCIQTLVRSLWRHSITWYSSDVRVTRAGIGALRCWAIFHCATEIARFAANHVDIVIVVVVDLLLFEVLNTRNQQEAQLSQRRRAMLCAVRNFAKSLKVVQGHSRLQRWVELCEVLCLLVIHCGPKYVSILLRYWHIQRRILSSIDIWSLKVIENGTILFISFVLLLSVYHYV